MANKLWDKGFKEDERIDAFTVGNDRELDHELAPYDIMGTMANTLVLAYIGSALCCMLLMVTYSSNVGQILNREQIAVEILQALAGSIGILAALPLTAITSVLCLKPLNRIKRSVH